jgi:hypothetical protein
MGGATDPDSWSDREYQESSSIHRAAVERLSWSVAAQLLEWFPDLVVLETHPGGGQYDCLSLAAPSARDVVIDMNRQGSIHVPLSRWRWEGAWSVIADQGVGFASRLIAHHAGFVVPLDAARPSTSALSAAYVAPWVGIAEERRPSPWRPLVSDERLTVVEGIVERMGLEAYADRPTEELPQGVRKLIDIAMTTVGQTQVLLLDEPTSGVSAEEKYDIMDRVMSALRETEVTVLFVEHDMEIVERYAERVVAFYNGRVIADGPTAEVLAAEDVRRYVVGSEIHRRTGQGD